MNLYQLSAEYEQLLNKDEYDLAEMEALDRLQDSVEDKAVNICYHIQNMEAEMQAVNEAQKRMYDRAKHLEMKIDSLKDYLKITLEKCKIDKITKSPNFVISVKINPPSVHVDDEGKIPAQFFKKKETLSLDKTLIKEAFDAGNKVPGASIIRRSRLEIK